MVPLSEQSVPIITIFSVWLCHAVGQRSALHTASLTLAQMCLYNWSGAFKLLETSDFRLSHPHIRKPARPGVFCSFCQHLRHFCLIKSFAQKPNRQALLGATRAFFPD